MTENRTHRYHRSDFGPLPAVLEHMDLFLTFGDDSVVVTNRLRVRAIQALSSLQLDARDLEILSISSVGDPAVPLDYNYRREANVLEITLPEPVSAGGVFSVETTTCCRPSDNILEGIYKDTTPAGCPQQYISQCQQWGFQRIAPVIDDCRAKCTLRTTIEADARYTHLISNGNVCAETNPDGCPVAKEGDFSRQLMTYDNPIPMAPYLFVVAVGTWEVLNDDVTYPSGRTVKLEYLVPPGRLEGAEVPMKILKDAVLWQNKTQDYEYRHDVYRTICMEKSNFGGMENVGNTTIITDAALIDDFTGDTRLQYAHGVIVHEFEHNQCGSDVTMETPFDMWLNEAFTVDVERQFMQSQFDPVCVRIGEIDDIRAPIGGPLAIEEGGHMGNIVREAFNDPDELVDGVTYVKAAEVIRMLKEILGPDVFRKAKTVYFERHNGGNANTDDFFACFEEISGRDLSQFRHEWLHTIGYPRVAARYTYDATARLLTVSFSQSRVGDGGLFHLPLSFAAVDEKGKDIPKTVQTVELTGEEQTFSFVNTPPPTFVSFNRGASFYGTFVDETSQTEHLHHQVWHDPDLLSRVEAMRRLTDQERIRLVQDPHAGVSDEWLFIYGRLLESTSLPAGILAYLLRIDELSLDRSIMPCYKERFLARQTLLKAVADRYFDHLLWVFDGLDTYAHTPDLKDGYEHRLLKGVLMQAIAAADSVHSHIIAEEHFRVAWHITEKASALTAIHASTNERRAQFLDDALLSWQHHLSGYTTYLRVLGSAPLRDCFDLIAAEEATVRFKPEHPSHSRALYLPVTLNNAIIWTDEGIGWLEKTILRQASLNENTAIRLLATWQLAGQLADDLKPKVFAAIDRLNAAVDSVALPALSGRIRAFLDEQHRL